jgi:flagellar hook capping protein FlgD
MTCGIRWATFSEMFACSSLSRFAALAVLGLAVCVRGAAVQELVSHVTVSPSTFRQGQDKQVRLLFVLAEKQTLDIRIYDAEDGLVRTVTEATSFALGTNEVSWDGRDSGGNPVPDEAYTFMICGRSGPLYDPATFSGGVVGDITKAHFDRDAGTVVYSLPAAARVLIRLGIKSGPMHKTLVDWRPRVAGSITEYWDGKDESKLINVREHKDFNALITYVTLPEATVITYGNEKESYRDYELGRGKNRPKRPLRPRQPDPSGRALPVGLVPPASSRAPQVLISFPKIMGDGKNSIPALTNTADIRVEVDHSDKEDLLRGQFEIIFFVDNVFFAEAERGYLPYNWRWEVNQLPAGEHTLTANISSFKGQVGVASRKVNVVKPSRR